MTRNEALALYDTICTPATPTSRDSRNRKVHDFHHGPLSVSLVVAHRRNPSRRVRAFMKWIENVLAPHLE